MMRARNQSCRPWVMLAPLTVLLAAVFVYPVGRAAAFAITRPGNFPRLVSDRTFLFALANTLAFAVVYVGLLVPLGLGLALLMNRSGLRNKGFWRAVFFSSFLVGPVYLAVMVTEVLAPDSVVGRLVAPGVDLLAIPYLAMPVVLVASLWSAAGYAMVYLLAALQGVDREMLDAARVDGASSGSAFWHVTLPTIAPTVAFVALTAAVGGMMLFELPFVLFHGPGPGNAAVTLSMVLFATQFEQGDPAYASAQGWALALLLTGLSALLVRMSTRRGHA